MIGFLFPWSDYMWITTYYTVVECTEKEKRDCLELFCAAAN